VRVRLRRGVLRSFSRLPARLKRSIVGALKPSYTVAAMVRIVRPDGAMLVVRTSYREGWVFPGGLCDRGEAPLETAVREVDEEVGLTVRPDGRPIVLVDPDMRRMDFVFEAGIDQETAAAVRIDPAEIAEHRWIARTDIPELEATDRTSVGRVLRAAEAGETVVTVEWNDIDGPLLRGPSDLPSKRSDRRRRGR